MSIIMISLQLWLSTGHVQYQMLWPHGCSFHWWCSPLFITYDQPEFTSLRTTFKPTSVHCEERRTSSNKHNYAHSSARDGIRLFIWRRTWANRTLTFNAGTWEQRVCPNMIQRFVACNYRLEAFLLHSARSYCLESFVFCIHWNRSTCVRYLVSRSSSWVIRVWEPN